MAVVNFKSFIQLKSLRLNDIKLLRECNKVGNYRSHVLSTIKFPYTFVHRYNNVRSTQIIKNRIIFLL